MAEITTVEHYLGLMVDPKVRAQVLAAQQKADADGRLDARKKLIAKKQSILCASDERLTGLIARAAAAREKAEIARQAARVALDEYRAAEGAILSCATVRDREIGIVDEQLRSDGDVSGRIGTFVEDLGTMWERERKAPSRSELRATGLFFKVSGRAETVAFSDHMSRARLLVAIRQAQAAAEALKLEALSAAEIEARLRVLAENLPEVVMENVAVDNVAA